MILALTLAFALQGGATEDADLASLRFIARHQRADGSWGERPEHCACPEAAPVAPVDETKVAPLLRALGDEDPGRRKAAHRELGRLGEAALPHLRVALADPDPEVRGRSADLCRRHDLAARGGPDAELTGLALLAFLGAGFSHLSKDTYDGIRFGDVVRKGLQWLIARQKEAGAFDAKDPVADAIAALALSEAYGLTGSNLFQEEAQRGIDRVAFKTPKESRGLIWKGMVLKSAEISGLALAKESVLENLGALESRRDDTAVAGFAMISIFAHRRKTDARLAAVGTLDPAALGPEAFHFATLSTFQFDGPSGPLWRRWNGELKRRIPPAQRMAKGSCLRGSWDGEGQRGRLQATALRLLSLEIYYR